MKNNKRVSGYYWVKYKRTDEWEIGIWNSELKQWQVGDDYWVSRELKKFDELFYINEARILNPDEQTNN